VRANYAYVLAKCRELCGDGRVLDYGCGEGDIVEAAAEQGISIRGVDAFYAGNRAREVVAERGLLGKLVFELEKDGTIPFEDGSFSLVVSNQVFEHVQDLDLVLREIFRVLKPGGMLLALFPSREVWREGHCGIPFSHWFHPDSRFRYAYMRLLRGIGLGYHKAGIDQAAWVRHKLSFLDRLTSYRSYREIIMSFGKVASDLESREADYIAFRMHLKGMRRAAGLVHTAVGQVTARILCRRLAGLVLIARKP
jgi:SAM-dependent methyltransferase